MLNKALFLNIYKHMLVSREADSAEAELVKCGDANFLASSRGHEGSAILAPLLKPCDYLHCHYRDKALMLARGISSTMFFYSALAVAESHSCGRQMVSHMSAREHNILSIVGPVGNNALQAAGIAHTLVDYPENAIVLCSLGDGTSQQGEVLEAIAEAKRSHLPVLFFIHNNDLAISTRTTGQTFFSLPDGSHPESFYATPIHYIDGTRPFESFANLGAIIDKIRETRAPQIVIFNVVRLDNHSNADDQLLYRSFDEVRNIQNSDPIILSKDYLKNHGVTDEELHEITQQVSAEIKQAVDTAKNGHKPQATFAAELALIPELQPICPEYSGDVDGENRITMLEAMRNVFAYQLAEDKAVCLLGQDIEDGKGDVFGITRGLSTKYPGRVTNTALSESTIVGMATGMALTGRKPVAFIQFADFMPLAYNQIYSELATMYWRSNGAWQCPVIVFAACGGYRPGLGPFHSQTNEATYAHIPGLDVYMPSNAGDAAGMLNAAFKSGRPSVFFYPKKLLNNSGRLDTTSNDVAKHLVPIGKARIVRAGSDITLVGWGNTVALCAEVVGILEASGIDAELIDLRTIKPYDLSTIVSSVTKTKHLIVVHEDNATCGMGAEIIAAVSELVNVPIKVRRVTRADTYTPCNYANQLEVLPSAKGILLAVAALLDFNVEFEQQEEEGDKALHIVKVLGASPSDESVIINKLHVQVGTRVETGDILVDIEASKSAGEILAPYPGVVTELFVAADCKALVGAPLLKMRIADEYVALASSKAQNNIDTINAILSRNTNVHEKVGANSDTAQASAQIFAVGMSIPKFKTGSRLVKNHEILQNFSGKDESDIERRTGIIQRYWLAEGESIIDIAAAVVTETLAAHNLQLSDINGVICATCSPESYQTPSMACLVLAKLYSIYGEQTMYAYDVNAACSGYVYALQSARDYLQTRPNERILLITAENLSSRLNLHDFDTAFLFGDAATATILYGANHINQAKAVLGHITLSATGEDGQVLNIPVANTSGIHLQGKKLFSIAVKSMSLAMHKCCHKSGIELRDIDVVIPHQANGRILAAVENRLKLPPGFIYSNIADYGNTSSCTIPIGLAQVLPTINSGSQVGLCAFGGGFTTAAALLTTI